jgi:hypothetical protein
MVVSALVSCIRTFREVLQWNWRPIWRCACLHSGRMNLADMIQGDMYVWPGQSACLLRNLPVCLKQWQWPQQQVQSVLQRKHYVFGAATHRWRGREEGRCNVGRLQKQQIQDFIQLQAHASTVCYYAVDAAAARPAVVGRHLPARWQGKAPLAPTRHASTLFLRHCLKHAGCLLCSNSIQQLFPLSQR